MRLHSENRMSHKSTLGLASNNIYPPIGWAVRVDCSTRPSIYRGWHSSLRSLLLVQIVYGRSRIRFPSSTRILCLDRGPNTKALALVWRAPRQVKSSRTFFPVLAGSTWTQEMHPTTGSRYCYSAVKHNAVTKWDHKWVWDWQDWGSGWCTKVSLFVMTERQWTCFLFMRWNQNSAAEPESCTGTATANITNVCDLRWVRSGKLQHDPSSPIHRNHENLVSRLPGNTFLSPLPSNKVGVGNSRKEWLSSTFHVWQIRMLAIHGGSSPLRLPLGWSPMTHRSCSGSVCTEITPSCLPTYSLPHRELPLLCSPACGIH